MQADTQVPVRVKGYVAEPDRGVWHTVRVRGSRVGVATGCGSEVAVGSGVTPGGNAVAVASGVAVDSDVAVG